MEQTDGRTDEQDTKCGLIVRPHNNRSSLSFWEHFCMPYYSMLYDTFWRHPVSFFTDVLLKAHVQSDVTELN